MESPVSQMLGTFVSLFVVVEPFSLVPIYLALTERFGASHKRVIRVKAVVLSTAILLVFAVSGTALFRFFGITIPAFRIAGGILLFQLGLDQLRASNHVGTSPEETSENLHRDDVSVFPLATPMIAGPASISAVALQASKSGGVAETAAMMAAIVAVMGSVYVILAFAPLLQRALGKTGLNLMTRLMGLLLTAIAVQFIIDGVREIWDAL